MNLSYYPYGGEAGLTKVFLNINYYQRKSLKSPLITWFKFRQYCWSLQMPVDCNKNRQYYERGKELLAESFEINLEKNNISSIYAVFTRKENIIVMISTLRKTQLPLSSGRK